MSVLSLFLENSLLKASLSKYYSKERKSKPVTNGEGDDDMDDGVPVLTRVLDLTRPAICALGPLMTHLEVSTCDRHIFSICTVQGCIRYSRKNAVVFVLYQLSTRTSTAAISLNRSRLYHALLPWHTALGLCI